MNWPSCFASRGRRLNADDGKEAHPELPGIDNRPRWSRRAVEQYSVVNEEWPDLASTRCFAPSTVLVGWVPQTWDSKIHERIAPGIYRLVSGSFRVKVGLGEMARGGRQRETAFRPARRSAR